jgi:diguanylate cyclase (GGDEF)-like protein
MKINDILDITTDEIFIFDAVTHMFLYTNKVARINLGYTNAEMKNISAANLNLKVDEVTFAEIEAPLITNTINTVTFVTTLQRKNKTIYDIRVSLQKTVFNGVDAYLAIVLDITKQLEVENELSNHAENLRKLTQYVPGTLYQFRLSPDGHFCFPYASENIYDIYEVKAEDLVIDAEQAFARHHPDDAKIVSDLIYNSAKTMKEWTCQYRVNLPSKGIRWLEGHSTPEKLGDGGVLWYGYIMDITERKTAEKILLEQKNVLHYQANYDSLTGIPNRTLFLDRLENAIKKSKRQPYKLAILFIDLDHFKKINDSLGHGAGDKVLIEVTNRLTSLVRAEDTVARLGGDEFTIILENITHTDFIVTLCNKIIEKLTQPIIFDGGDLYVSCSIGISLCPDDNMEANNLLKYADSAMYKAKNRGGNTFQFYDKELTKLACERVSLEAGLRSAIKDGELEVYYQPQVDGRTDKLIGIEALVRWNHPTRGLILPDSFIPLAESTSLIINLDRFVMEQAMTQVAQWYEKGLNPGVLALNLAVKQIHKDDFIEMCKQLILKTKCKPEWLEFEVTEGQIMTNPDKAVRILQDIRDLGISLAIDDFGTGYSSLFYLKKFPINKLKIDREFIKNLPEDKEYAAITKGIINLSKILNLQVIAEGVETEEQKDFMVKYGCNDIQGYFYSKPLIAGELEIILQNGCSLS